MRKEKAGGGDLGWFWIIGKGGSSKCQDSQIPREGFIGSYPTAPE